MVNTSKTFLFFFTIFLLTVFIIPACDENSIEPHAGSLLVSKEEIELIWIPSTDSFSIGSGTVKLNGFYMGKYEVTQEQYEKIMERNPSYFHGGSGREPDGEEVQRKRPVDYVTWFDAIEFCNNLSIKEALTPYYTISNIVRDAGNSITSARVAITSGNGYRLPTEVQWQYASQAGSIIEVVANQNIAWTSEISKSITHEVGLKEANTWGLYDMMGNVWEWCWDWYGSSYPNNGNNPMGAPTGTERIYRGGSWSLPFPIARSANRYSINPGYKYNTLGFRIIRP